MKDTTQQEILFEFTSPIPEGFLTDKEIFEDFILDYDNNNVFGELKEQVSIQSGLDIDNESQEQKVNEIVWQMIYDLFKVSFKSHY